GGSVGGLTIQSGSWPVFSVCVVAGCAIASRAGVVGESPVRHATRNNMTQAGPTLGIIFSNFAIFDLLRNPLPETRRRRQVIVNLKASFCEMPLLILLFKESLSRFPF